jgi:YVTN family beta-propeller protein
VIARIKTGGAPGGFGATADALWVGSTFGTDIFRIDPATNGVTRIRLGTGGFPWLEATADAVWAANRADGTVTRLDPRTNRVVAAIRVGANPVDGVVGPDGLVWIPNQGDDTISRIDPGTNRVVDTVRVGRGPFVVRQAFGDMWASSFAGDDVWRVHSPRS